MIVHYDDTMIDTAFTKVIIKNVLKISVGYVNTNFRLLGEPVH